MDQSSDRENRIQGLTPIILFSLSGIFWAILAYFKLTQWGWSLGVLGAIITALYLLWLLAESKVAIKEPGKGNTNKDGGSLEFYAFGRIATITAALALPTVWNEINIWIIAGFILFLSGVAFRLYAIRTLGRFYSHRVRKIDKHRIIDNGPYRIVRHPSYTGMIVANIGFVLFFFNIATFLLLVLAFIPAVVYRISVEERMLFEIEGYREYSRNRARLVPHIW